MLGFVRLFVTPCTVALQAPLSVGTQARLLEGLPVPPPGDFPHPGENGIELAFHVLAGRLPSTVPPGKILLFV